MKHDQLKLNSMRCRGIAAPLLCLALATSAPAGTIIKGTTGTDLTLGASWGGTAPGSGDVATWINSSLGAGLTLGSDSSWGGISVSSAASDIDITGAGTLTLGASGIDMSASTVNLSIGNPIALAASQTWNVNAGEGLTVAGVISGDFGLAKSGGGMLELTNAETYSGDTTVNGGTLALPYNPGDGPTAALAGGTTVTVNTNGTLLVGVEDGLGYGGGIPAQLNIIGGLVTSADVANTIPVQSFGGTSFRVSLPQLNFTGGTLSSGVNNEGDAYGGSFLIVNVNTSPSSSTAVINAYSVTLQNSVFTVASGTTPSAVDLNVSAILNDWFGPQSLTKAGPGVMVLDSANTYSGPTTVSGGTLVLLGSIVSGPTRIQPGGTLVLAGSLGVGGQYVLVSTGATLLGTGSINDFTTIQAGGTLGVGTTNIGSLQINDTLLLNAGSTTYMKLNKTGGTLTNDSVQSLSVSFGGTLTVTNITTGGALLALGDTVPLFPGGTYAGGFSTFNLPALPTGLGWDTSQLTLNGSIRVTSGPASPTFSPAAGGYEGAQIVTISSLTPGATIYYTTDNSTPTTGSAHGTSPVTVVLPLGTNMTLKAYAVATGYGQSSVQSATYTTIATPTWVVPSGGSWSTAGNWSNNIVPNGSGVTADFSTLALGADSTVTLDIPAAAGYLVFADQGNAYNWNLVDGGVGPLTLDAGTNMPTITVLDTNATISAVLAGTGGLAKSGAGSLTLSNANSYTGGTLVNAGTLALAYNPNDGSTGTLAGGTTVTVNTNGTLLLEVEDALGYGLTGGAVNGGIPAQININGGLVTSANVASTTPVQNGGPSFRVTLPNLNFTGGTLSSGTNNHGDVWVQSCYLLTNVNTSPSSNTAVINAYSMSLYDSLFTVASGTTPSGVDLSVSAILNDWLTGPESLIKAGPGLMVLNNNANTYSGSTTVSGGTLALAGTCSIASSTNIVIAGGATLDVSGLSAAFALASGQTLSNSTSTAVLKGSASTGSGAVSLTYASGTPSLTVTNGTLTLSASTVFNVNNIGAALAEGSYKIISKSTAGAVAGTLPLVTVSGGGVAAGATVSLNLTNAELDLAVTLVNTNVNTNPTNITASVSGTTLNLFWPPDHLGWTMQTNSVGLTATNQWFPYAGSGAVTNVTINIDTTKAKVFFRMVYP